jgi:hypothetical protein
MHWLLEDDKNDDESSQDAALVYFKTPFFLASQRTLFFTHFFRKLFHMLKIARGEKKNVPIVDRLRLGEQI